VSTILIVAVLGLALGASAREIAIGCVVGYVLSYVVAGLVLGILFLGDCIFYGFPRPRDKRDDEVTLDAINELLRPEPSKEPPFASPEEYEAARQRLEAFWRWMERLER
jgi:hypothetical protein